MRKLIFLGLCAIAGVVIGILSIHLGHHQPGPQASAAIPQQADVLKPEAAAASEEAYSSDDDEKCGTYTPGSPETVEYETHANLAGIGAMKVEFVRPEGACVLLRFTQAQAGQPPKSWWNELEDWGFSVSELTIIPCPKSAARCVPAVLYAGGSGQTDLLRLYRISAADEDAAPVIDIAGLELKYSLKGSRLRVDYLAEPGSGTEDSEDEDATYERIRQEYDVPSGELRKPDKTSAEAAAAELDRWANEQAEALFKLCSPGNEAAFAKRLDQIGTAVMVRWASTPQSAKELVHKRFSEEPTRKSGFMELNAIWLPYLEPVTSLGPFAGGLGACLVDQDAIEEELAKGHSFDRKHLAKSIRGLDACLQDGYRHDFPPFAERVLTCYRGFLGKPPKQARVSASAADLSFAGGN